MSSLQRRKGRTDILKRKKQVPLPEYSPQVAVRTVLDALQINDDPQLDHGCCVLLAFKSPSGTTTDSTLDAVKVTSFITTQCQSSLRPPGRKQSRPFRLWSLSALLCIRTAHRPQSVRIHRGAGTAEGLFVGAAASAGVGMERWTDGQLRRGRVRLLPLQYRRYLAN